MDGKASLALLNELEQDFKRLKQQKARPGGGVEVRVLMNLGFVGGEHYMTFEDGRLFVKAPTDQDKNRLSLSFDLIGPRLSKLIGRLAGINPPFRASPSKRSPQALEEAEVVNQLLLALDQKLDQPSKMWEILWWLAIGGTAFEHTPWVKDVTRELMPQFSPQGELLFTHLPTGQQVPQSQMEQIVAGGQIGPEQFEVFEEVVPVGDVGSEIFGPLNVFVDQSVKSIASLAPDQRVYIAQIRTVGWIEENFGVKVDPDKSLSIISTQYQSTGTRSGGVFLKDLIPLVQGSRDEHDPPMNVVVQAYSPPSKKSPRGRYECFIPGKGVLHSEESPYDEIPLTDFHWKPVTTSFWTPDYVSSLIAPQKFINKRFSQMGEQSNATLYSNLLLAPGLKASDIPTDYPGVVEGGLDGNGNPQAQRMPPPEFPSWFIPSVELIMRAFNDIAGGSDLFQEDRYPGQLRGPMAVPMLQEILDTEWGPFYNHLGDRLARVKQLRLNRVRQFYPPIRTLHYTSRDQKDEVLTFHKDKVLPEGMSFNISVDRGSLMPEMKALKEQRLTNRLSGPLAVLYMDQRTGSLDSGKIASELSFGDSGRESRTASYHKLGAEIVEMIWKGEPVPPVLPFYDHKSMMDELEAAMATTEYLRASPTLQAAFTDRWNAHGAYLQQEAAQQQQMMQTGLIQNAVAQATQQAAAQAAAMAVEEAMQQVKAQKEVGQTPPDQQVPPGQAENAANRAEKPPVRSRKLTVEERS